MNKEVELKKINTEIKIYINEASFISRRCRNQLIKMLGKTYDIVLPVEDFLHIDVEVLEQGNICMRGDLFSREEALSFEEVVERYQVFREKALEMLTKKGKKSFPNSERNNLINLFVVFLLLLIFLFFAYFCIQSFFHGKYLDCLWILFIVFSWFIPGVKDRFLQAFHYLKRKMK